MPKQFNDILDKASKELIANERRRTSLEWFRTKVNSLGRPVRPADLLLEKQRLQERFEYGKMFHYKYNPKHAAKLPYYDLFPLCIPVRPARGGFIGINLHYLYPKQRALLLEKFREIEAKDTTGELRFKLTYQLLDSSDKYKLFRPCIKRYLFAHVKSKFIKIDPQEWNIAIFLPTEMFVKEKKIHVWEDSDLMVKDL